MNEVRFSPLVKIMRWGYEVGLACPTASQHSNTLHAVARQQDSENVAEHF